MQKKMYIYIRISICLPEHQHFMMAKVNNHKMYSQHQGNSCNLTTGSKVIWLWYLASLPEQDTQVLLEKKIAEMSIPLVRDLGQSLNLFIDTQSWINVHEQQAVETSC